jgi:hypothetical protein
MTTIGTIEIERESVVFIFDARTGRIVHSHHVVTMKGGVHPDQKTIERDAQEQLTYAQPALRLETAILHVDPATIKPRTLYNVDVSKLVLVEQPPKRSSLKKETK